MNNNNIEVVEIFVYIEVVENFVYLGSQLCNEGGSEADMKWRIALAGVTFHRLWEKVFKTCDQPSNKT